MVSFVIGSRLYDVLTYENGMGVGRDSRLWDGLACVAVL
jgi:hypothetical protein